MKWPNFPMLRLEANMNDLELLSALREIDDVIELGKNDDPFEILQSVRGIARRAIDDWDSASEAEWIEEGNFPP